MLTQRLIQKLLAVSISAVLVLPHSGCMAWKPLSLNSSAEKGPALPAEYQGYYDYPAGDLSATVIEEKKTGTYTVKTVEFPLSLSGEVQMKDLAALKQKTEELAKTDQKTANDLKLRYTNRIDFYIPNTMKPGENRPVILISPILGGNMVVDRFASYYTGRGYIAALVHRKRLIWDDEEGMEQVENYLRTSIIRLRQAVDWVSAQPEVDASRIGAFGVSYGAILHSILAAVEPRIRYHVLSLPAAPIADVLVHCPDKACVKLIKKILEKYGWSDEEIQAQFRKLIKTDPVYLAPYIPRNKVLTYIAVFDRVVGARRSVYLWRKMGRPELKLLPFGHYGGILIFSLLQTQKYLPLKKNPPYEN